MNIVLIGMPGCGKSTLGRQLALHYGYQFVDTDDQIVAEEGMTIEKIFADKGETFFRKCEVEVLKRILNHTNQIISTGGGLPCFFENMAMINQYGISVYLDVPVEEIANRIGGSKANVRPMFSGKKEDEILEFLKIKMREREVYYKKAKVVVSGGNINCSEIAKAIDGKK